MPASVAAGYDTARCFVPGPARLGLTPNAVKAERAALLIANAALDGGAVEDRTRRDTQNCTMPTKYGEKLVLNGASGSRLPSA